MREIVATERAPKAVGPYSQGVRAGGTVWVSGQVALEPGTGRLIEGGIEPETRRVLENLKAILEEAGSSLSRVVKVSVFLADMNDYEAMNRVYASFFGPAPPARVTVEVSRLPRGARVEIDAIGLV